MDIVPILREGGVLAVAVGIGIVFWRGIALLAREHNAIVKALTDSHAVVLAELRAQNGELREQRDGWRKIAESTADELSEQAASTSRLAASVDALRLAVEATVGIAK